MKTNYGNWIRWAPPQPKFDKSKSVAAVKRKKKALKLEKETVQLKKKMKALEQKCSELKTQIAGGAGSNAAMEVQLAAVALMAVPDGGASIDRAGQKNIQDYGTANGQYNLQQSHTSVVAAKTCSTAAVVARGVGQKLIVQKEHAMHAMHAAVDTTATVIAELTDSWARQKAFYEDEISVLRQRNVELEQELQVGIERVQGKDAARAIAQIKKVNAAKMNMMNQGHEIEVRDLLKQLGDMKRKLGRM